MAGKVKLSADQQRRLAAIVNRWEGHETWIANAFPDGHEFGNKAEMLRNLGSAIAAGRALLSASGKDD